MNGNGWRRLGSYGERMGVPPGVFVLLVANLAVAVLRFFTVSMGRVDPLGYWFSFVPHLAINNVQIWRFVSYMFLHGDLMHLFFNMLGLWLFGSRIEALWGTRTFMRYYFACGIGGAVLYGLFSLTGISSMIPMVGASGAIYGILLAFGLAFPTAVIFVFFIPMQARIAVIVFAALSFLGIGGANVAHLAHLGGMVAGFIFLWIFTGGRPSQVPRLPRSGSARAGHRPGGGSTGPAVPHRGGGGSSLLTQLYRQFVRWRTRMRLKVVGGGQKRGDTEGGASGGNGRTDGGRSGNNLQRVDEILEKISREGLKSLTPEEQDILRRASKRD